MKKNRRLMIFAAAYLVVLAIVVIICVVVNKHKTSREEEWTEEESSQEETQMPAREEDTPEITDKWAYALELVQGSDEELAQALAVFEELAQTDADAQYIAGEMYLQGIGTEQDMDKASSYIAQAYKNGVASACGIYGRMSFMGEGEITQSYEAAQEALLVTAYDDAAAACAIGIMYMYGMGAATDYDMANAWLELAVSGGYEEAAQFQALIQDYVTASADAVELPTSKKALWDSRAESDSADDAAAREYMEQLKGGEGYEAFDSELEALASMNFVMATQVAIFGDDNWLFLKNPNDGTAYNDYIGDNAYTDEELAAIAKVLGEQKENVEAQGAQFVLLLIPNKEIIYSEKMPSYIERVSEESRADKLVEYLRENTDINVIYPKDTYMANKDDMQLYYSTDTHFNMVGAYFAMTDLINSVYGRSLGLDDVVFTENMLDYCGDLGVLIGREDRYSSDIVYYLQSTSVSDDEKLDESMLLIGDSFSEFLNMEAEYFFAGGVEHVMIMDYNYDYWEAAQANVQGTDADIVVFECAQRYLDRLLQ